MDDARPARSTPATGRQWKSRSVLLIPPFYKEKPQPLGPGPQVRHSGPLLQLTGKGLLQPGSWKRRYCVLDSSRLLFYGDKQEASRESRTSNYVDLEPYDVCEEAKGARDPRKSGANVLVVSSSEIEKSFFDTGRIYLAAETLTEMNEWISHIRSAVTSIRNPSPTPAPRRVKAPAVERTHSEGSSTSTPRTKCKAPLDSDGGDGAPLEPTEHLDCVTKQRAKGPAGRRLPRNAKPRWTGTDAGADAEADAASHRSESLPRLEDSALRGHEASGRRHHHHHPNHHHQHNRSFDMSQHRATKQRASTLYAYSSSEESLSLPFIQQQQQQDDETVETLCEVPSSPPIHHSTSTPSLVQLAERQWLSVGSSCSTPRPTATAAKRRPAKVYYREQAAAAAAAAAVAVAAASDSTSADDPPDVPQQYQLLLQQTAAMKTTLCGLEVEFGASRRDLGWLQENLTSVRNATGSVSEKVAKMQSQVATMERQISGAVKEAQQLQQKANDALKSASDAERDFRRLESECQALLSQLIAQQRHQQQHRENEQYERQILLNDPVCLSPMTPHPPDMTAMNFTHRASSSIDAADNPFGWPPPPELKVPPTFDFAALFAKSIGGGGASTETATPRIKSSIRNSDAGKTSAAKSISFGPITTFAASGSPGDESDEPHSPVATSTLIRQNNNNHAPLSASLLAS